MRTMQLRGPFSEGVDYSFTVTGVACQIGLELGRTLSFFDKTNMLEPIFEINGVPYFIGDTCILEWGDIATKYIKVTPLKNLDEYAIIDVAYE